MQNTSIIYGKTIDKHTRCVHYHSKLDIIAIKTKCCNKYYPCYYCHQETALHTLTPWNKNEFDTKAILCGECYNELSINEYLNSKNQCPFCCANFNPDCSKHYHFYFDF